MKLHHKREAMAPRPCMKCRKMVRAHLCPRCRDENAKMGRTNTFRKTRTNKNGFTSE